MMPQEKSAIFLKIFVTSTYLPFFSTISAVALNLLTISFFLAELEAQRP